MIEAFRKVWHFADDERKNINRSIFFCFINAILKMSEIAAIYVVLLALLDGRKGGATAWYALGLVIVSILATTIMKSNSQLCQTHAGYFMVANKRIDIANRIKTVPMGYFNENNLGELTGVTTTVLDNVENLAPMVLVTILSGFINAVIFIVMILCWDWRIGLIVVTGTIAYILITSNMEYKSRELAPHRQNSEAVLVGAVLEYVQGISIVKSFNLAGHGDKTVQSALEYNQQSNAKLEKLFTPYTIMQSAALQLSAVGMMLAAVVFFVSGTMSNVDALMTVIMSFLVFAQIQSAGSGLSVMRIVCSSIDHAKKMDDIPQLDESGEDIHPQTHDIVFENVSFSYDKKEILHNVSFTIADKTTTAVVGPSGAGKTTMTSLIARFWDVDAGRITIGGYDVKNYTLEALTARISMVFQNVYLFADTIENNIKFGRPNATHGEVAAAAKNACCAEFIEALPNGYDTLIGEGGASLSGGERQRISIARAMLKDAPIIVLDEATANVDPENEAELQKAIEKLTHDKTIVMIAHRLKTVRNADQILVVNDRHIVRHGRHDELINEDGIYAEFVTGRQEAVGWKIATDL